MRHEEQNDALVRKNRIALERYKFAIDCLKNRIRYIIDSGCGMGYGVNLLKREGHHVLGVDHSKQALSYARNNYNSFYCQWNLETINLPKDFDTVVCLEVLCHLKEPQKFIDRIENKELIISAPIDPSPNDGYIYRLHNLSEVDFRNLLKNWRIIKEFRQKNYLTIYCEKL